MRIYIWVWLVCVVAMGCDEVVPELLSPPVTSEREEMPPTSEVSVDTPGIPDALLVRAVYIEPRLPAGQASRYREKAEDIDALVRYAQTFFARELERHGYPRRTFTVNETHDGRVHVERITLEHESAFYQTDDGRLEFWTELLIHEIETYGHGANSGYPIEFVDVPGYRIPTFSGDACARGETQLNGDSLSGRVHLPWVQPAGCDSTETILVHELMHAFGLFSHDWRSDDYMLSYGASRHKISPGAAKWLAHHPAFLGRVPVSAAERHNGDVVLQTEPSLQYTRIGTSEIYQFELRFTAWFLRTHLQQESAGFVHGVLSYDNDNLHDVQNRRWGLHVLRYLDAARDANVLRVLDNDTLRRQYIDGGVAYVVRFEAELPVHDDGFILDLLQYDGVRHSIYMKNSANGQFHREW